MDIKKAINKVINFTDLTEKEMHSVFNTIMSGEATPAQIAAFIVALRMKGETVEEITGAAKVMREKATKIKVTGKSKVILDTCGTGGTGINTFNISTTAAFVLAACGVKVAKHGNRAVSGRCGSADVLEGLGVKIDVSAGVTEKCINSIGIGFLFAPLFHGAMRYAMPPRREIGVRTIFNVLGPLCNPALATRQVLGVYDGKLTEVMAMVLKKLGTTRGYVVHGAGPLDEVTIIGKTRISEIKGGKVKTYNVTPGTFGIKKASLESIKGGSAKQNAKIIRDIFAGKKSAKRDVVLINSSLALMSTGKAKGPKEGVRIASEAIDSGKAQEKLEELIRITNK